MRMPSSAKFQGCQEEAEGLRFERFAFPLSFVRTHLLRAKPNPGISKYKLNKLYFLGRGLSALVYSLLGRIAAINLRLTTRSLVPNLD